MQPSDAPDEPWEFYVESGALHWRSDADPESMWGFVVGPTFSKIVYPNESPSWPHVPVVWIETLRGPASLRWDSGAFESTVRLTFE